LIISIISFSHYSKAQVVNKGLVQFSGVVVTGDSLQPVPYSSIIVRGTYRGTISDYGGFFSFVAQMGDTIDFSAVGFKKSSFVIPDTLQTDRYSLIKIMSSDTFLLREAVIYPWPTKEQFRQAFLDLRVPDDDLDRARRNMALEVDGSGNYKTMLLERQTKVYTNGQYPAISLLNPIAWAQFIESWQRGDFKRKNKD